jgi:hypothetical protein
MLRKLVGLAALVVASTGLSNAQIFSVNAVGYINVTVKPGFNLIANQLFAQDNSIGSLFKNFDGGVVPGTTIYKLVDGKFLTATWDDLDNQYVPESTAAELTLPGDGVFVYLPGSREKVLTFVGEVLQGEVCTEIPSGYSIKSSAIPQTLDFNALNFPGSPGDKVFRFNARTASFQMFQFDEVENRWPDTMPDIPVGEAVMVLRMGPAVDWCRTFFVNNPG